MKLGDIAYEILMLLRGSYISDDERVDLRLIEQLIHQYRIEYIKEYNRLTKSIPESFVQTSNIELALTVRTTYKSLESSNSIPRITIGKFGPLITGIYSPYVNEPSFTIVNRNQLKFSGTSKFNSKLLYISYYDNRLVIKSNNPGYNNMTDCDVVAVWENPTLVPEFNVEEDDYPLDMDCVNFIKEKFMSNETKPLVGQYSDETNDTSGKIEE